MRNVASEKRLGFSSACKFWLSNNEDRDRATTTIVIKGLAYDRLAAWGKEVTSTASRDWERWHVSGIRSGRFALRVSALATKAQKIRVDYMGEEDGGWPKSTLEL